MQRVDFKKVFTLAGMTGKCESLSITIDDGKVIEGGTEMGRQIRTPCYAAI